LHKITANLTSIDIINSFIDYGKLNNFSLVNIDNQNSVVSVTIKHLLCNSFSVSN